MILLEVLNGYGVMIATVSLLPLIVAVLLYNTVRRHVFNLIILLSVLSIAAGIILAYGEITETKGAWYLYLWYMTDVVGGTLLLRSCVRAYVAMKKKRKIRDS